MAKFTGRPQVYDRDMLHKYFWEHTNSNGLVQVRQADLADDLGCSPTTVKALLKELKLLGKVERVPGSRITVLKVYPPDPDKPINSKNRKREVMWG